MRVQEVRLSGVEVSGFKGVSSMLVTQPLQCPQLAGIVSLSKHGSDHGSM